MYLSYLPVWQLHIEFMDCNNFNYISNLKWASSPDVVAFSIIFLVVTFILWAIMVTNKRKQELRRLSSPLPNILWITWKRPWEHFRAITLKQRDLTLKMPAISFSRSTKCYAARLIQKTYKSHQSSTELSKSA